MENVMPYCVGRFCEKKHVLCAKLNSLCHSTRSQSKVMETSDALSKRRTSGHAHAPASVHWMVSRAYLHLPVQLPRRLDRESSREKTNPCLSSSQKKLMTVLSLPLFVMFIGLCIEKTFR